MSLFSRFKSTNRTKSKNMEPINDIVGDVPFKENKRGSWCNFWRGYTALRGDKNINVVNLEENKVVKTISLDFRLVWAMFSNQLLIAKDTSNGVSIWNPNRDFQQICYLNIVKDIQQVETYDNWLSVTASGVVLVYFSADGFYKPNTKVEHVQTFSIKGESLSNGILTCIETNPKVKAFFNGVLFSP